MASPKKKQPKVQPSPSAKKSKSPTKKTSIKSKSPTKKTTSKSKIAQQDRAVSVQDDRSVIQSGERDFLIVGLGASAGGLEALEQFFTQMPADTGMAFVVVTHQHPGHISLLPELLQKSTGMKVLEATDRIHILQNHIYVGPGGVNLSVIKGVLHFLPIKPMSTLRLPIDHFFRSLAEDQKDRAVSIILSGTGTDGSLGLKAIKGYSGMTMVQSVHSAKYGGMPQSAMMTDQVDYVLPVGEMPLKLISYAQAHYLTGGEDSLITYEHTSSDLEKIYIVLRTHTGNDFSNYKVGTIRRRIDRRMNVHQLRTAKQYLRFLQEHPDEVDILFRELLIGVTAFFRDPPAFDALAKHMVANVLGTKSREDGIRVWVCACATGEEAYSIAILLHELMEDRNQHVPLQIFATDLDKQAIEFARTGLYPEGIAMDMTPERLARFFIKDGTSYKIVKLIRDMVIFAPHNLIVDPPFTKVDMLSCRNFLIYLDADLQRRLMPLFHYALKPQGVLFLGSSESLAGFADYFTVLDKKWKLFQRSEGSIAPYFQKKFLSHALTEPDRQKHGLPIHLIEKERNIPMLTQSVLLARFVPPSVLVNEQGDIAYIHGRTGNFLEPASGQPTNNLFDMARDGLRLEVVSGVREAAYKDQEVVHTGVQVKTDGGARLVNVIVKKITESTGLKGLFLVTFVVITPGNSLPEKKGSTSRGPIPKKEKESLEHELEYTKDRLHLTIEELETSNEELKSLNEELQSTNEEMQSVNEELETAREEMQSLNEELQMVNAELQMKVDDLTHTYDDMQNLLNSTDIATIFLDAQLNINQFTPQAKKLINLRDADIGRPLSDLAIQLKYEHLLEDAQAVLRTLIFKEVEVQTREGGWYLMRITPYRTTKNKIEGLVITFVDITKGKQTDKLVLESNEGLAIQKVALTQKNDSFIRALGEIVYEHDVSRGRITWGGAYSSVLGYSKKEMSDDAESWLGKVHPDDIQAVTREYAQARTRDQLYDLEYRFRIQAGSYLWMHDRGVMHLNEKGELVRVIGIMRNITHRKQDEELLKELHLALLHATPGISLLDVAGRYVHVNDAYANMLGYSPAELIGQPWLVTVHLDDHATAMMAFEAMGSRETGECEVRAIRQDGSLFTQHVVIVKRIRKAGEPESYHCLMRAINQLRAMGVGTLSEG